MKLPTALCSSSRLSRSSSAASSACHDVIPFRDMLASIGTLQLYMPGRKCQTTSDPIATIADRSVDCLLTAAGLVLDNLLAHSGAPSRGWKALRWCDFWGTGRARCMSLFNMAARAEDSYLVVAVLVHIVQGCDVCGVLRHRLLHHMPLFQ